MIFTRYSNKVLHTASALSNFYDKVKKSQWRLKFAWRPVKVSVPGEDDTVIQHYAVLRIYYTRDLYELRLDYSGYSFKHRKTVNVASKDSLSYFSLESNDEAVTFENNNMCTFNHLTPYKFLISSDSKVYFYYDRFSDDRVLDHLKYYKEQYDLIKDSKLAKGLLTPDEYEETVFVGRIK